MAITRGLFMSERPDWETPPAVFEYFNKQYRFTLEVRPVLHDEGERAGAFVGGGTVLVQPSVRPGDRRVVAEGGG